jgi:hypothetical protein
MGLLSAPASAIGQAPPPGIDFTVRQQITAGTALPYGRLILRKAVPRRDGLLSTDDYRALRSRR